MWVSRPVEKVKEDPIVDEHKAPWVNSSALEHLIRLADHAKWGQPVLFWSLLRPNFLPLNPRFPWEIQVRVSQTGEVWDLTRWDHSQRVTRRIKIRVTQWLSRGCKESHLVLWNFVSQIIRQILEESDCGANLLPLTFFLHDSPVRTSLL